MNNYFQRTSLATIILIWLIAVLAASCTTRCQPYYTGRGCAPVNQTFAAKYAGALSSSQMHTPILRCLIRSLSQ